ncbi:hypothetical protein [Haloplanus halophilus]|uniref:hypothetical protein n=1 Tax=Haloplanus halophilus TaxID=2949993 RepID=UPI00203B0F2B|nr:hypothetical protein [Haloplanus sp. GDY1]
MQPSDGRWTRLFAVLGGLVGVAVVTLHSPEWVPRPVVAGLLGLPATGLVYGTTDRGWRTSLRHGGALGVGMGLAAAVGALG